MSVIPGLDFGDAPEEVGASGSGAGAGVSGIGTTGGGDGAGDAGPVVVKSVELVKEQEWRFELGVGRGCEVKLTAGTAELFGTELVLNKAYTFLSTKAAVFTWTGCALEISHEQSALTSDYVAEETTMTEAVNIHLALEAMRARDTNGPRVLILGQEGSGKTTLAKILTAYAIRSGRAPVVVGLDPSESILSLPGTLTATVFKTLVEVEGDAGGGWGTSPMSGPNGEIPVKLPLVYYFGGTEGELGMGRKRADGLYRALTGRLGLAVSGRMKGDQDVERSGLIIDSPAELLSGIEQRGGYDMVAHVVSEFSVNAIVCLGSERVYNDMLRKFEKQPVSGSGARAETISVVKVPKSGGVVEKDVFYMKAVAEAQIRSYFYGNPKVGANISLQPRQQQVDFDTLPVIWRRIASGASAMGYGDGKSQEDEFLPGGADDDDYAPPEHMTSVPLPDSQLYEKMSNPVKAMASCVLAVMNCVPDPDDQEVLRDSSCMGFLYVTDVDVEKQRISLLSPVAGRVPNRALVWSEGMEPILGVVG